MIFMGNSLMLTWKYITLIFTRSESEKCNKCNRNLLRRPHEIKDIVSTQSQLSNWQKKLKIKNIESLVSMTRAL
jgi:hypothetical protein